MSRPVERASWSRIDYTMALAEASLKTSAPLFESERLKSAGCLNEALASYRRLCDSLELQLALSLEHNEEYDAPHTKITPLVNSLANAQMAMAGVSATLGDRDGAEQLRGQATGLVAKYMLPIDVAQRKRELASVRAGQRRYNEAITLLAEARDELERRGDVLASADVASQLAETLEWLGDAARAAIEAGRARALLDHLLPAQAPAMLDVLQLTMRNDLAGAVQRAEILKIWSQLVQLEARGYRDRHDPDRAAALYRKLKPAVPTMVQPGIDFQLARLDIEGGRAQQGLSALTELEPLFTGLLRPKLGVLLVWKARALLELGRAREAIDLASRGVDDLIAQGDLDSLWRAQWIRARVLLALEQSNDAFDQLADAVATIGDLRHGTLGHRLDSTYLADKLPVIEAALDMAVSTGRGAHACRILEQVKSRALTAILSVPRGGDVDVAAVDTIDTLSRELDHLEYEAFTSGWSDEVKTQRSMLLKRRATVIERTRIAEPRWRSLSEPPTFDPEILSQRLGHSNRAALSLYLRPHQVIAVLVDGEGCIAKALELAPVASAALDAYQASLASVSPIDPGDVAGLDLAALLPEDLIVRAMRAEHVVVAPHGFLHLVPWAMLRWRDDRLFQHCPISIVPNLSWLMQPQRSQAQPPSVALIGDPSYVGGVRALDLAGEELDEIASLYAGQVIRGRPVKGEAATEAAFRELATSPEGAGGTLHVVSHGDFVPEEPLYSGLLLTNGKIDAAEISRLRLTSAEVVLSACSSGYRPQSVDGVPLTGDDVVGLVGAFLEAGAGHVVVSITRARDDASYAFMTTYHQYRSAGLHPVRAMQKTQLEMLKSGRYTPSLWAGFVVYGS